MVFLLKQIFGLLKLLNSDTGTNQLALGVATGFILGMSPVLSLQALLIFLCLFIFRIQIGAAFISAFFFAFVAWLFDPLFHAVGAWLLELPALRAPWTTLYNAPLIPFTRFNNSVVMGAGFLAFILSPAIFLGARKLIEKYRATVVARFQETKLWKFVKSTAFFKWYYQYDKLYG